MELKIKPAIKNTFPLKGFLIKGSLVKEWLLELQLLSFNLNDIKIYPIPGSVANSTWGCLIVCKDEINSEVVGRNELCQSVKHNFYIPERTAVSPVISDMDRERLFSGAVHVFHPDFGITQLEEIFSFEELLLQPEEKHRNITKPENAGFVPKEIRSFQVKPVEPEDVLEQLEKKVVPKSESIPNKPLNSFEKGKLAFYKKIFSKSDSDSDKGREYEEPKGFLKKMFSFMNSVSKKEGKLEEKMMNDFENLEERNKKQIDKLLDLLKNNPEDALKYAIPLDNNGSSRGSDQGQLDISKRWNSFSLFSESRIPTSNSGGAANIGDHYNTLLKQYNKTAETLINNKEYEKAAFVYMKLLKNYHKAAITLEDGALYLEAATIYLKHNDNKLKAAECYEKGNMIQEAIDLHEELKDYCKVGDLYMTLQKRNLALEYYEKSADVHKQSRQYIKASEVYRDKICNDFLAQNILMKGWEDDCDAYRCLEQYFSYISEINEFKEEFDSVYANKINETNRGIFLKLVEKEYKQNNELAKHLREIGYEIIASEVQTNPQIVDELNKFNPNDKEIIKDASRFLNNGRRRG